MSINYCIYLVWEIVLALSVALLVLQLRTSLWKAPFNCLPSYVIVINARRIIGSSTVKIERAVIDIVLIIIFWYWTMNTTSYALVYCNMTTTLIWSEYFICVIFPKFLTISESVISYHFSHSFWSSQRNI